MIHPYRFYLVNKITGSVHGTNFTSEALAFARNSGLLVIDSFFGETQSDGSPLTKILPYQLCPGCVKESPK